MHADTFQFRPDTVAMAEQDIIELLELQRLTRELLDHLIAMFAREDTADLLRAMAHGWRPRGATKA